MYLKTIIILITILLSANVVSSNNLIIQCKDGTLLGGCNEKGEICAGENLLDRDTIILNSDEEYLFFGETKEICDDYLLKLGDSIDNIVHRLLKTEKRFTAQFIQSVDLEGYSSLLCNGAETYFDKQYLGRVSNEVKLRQDCNYCGKCEEITQKMICPDFNNDNQINFEDFFLLSDSFSFSKNDEFYNENVDLDRDEKIDFDDFFIFADWFGKKCENEVNQCVDGTKYNRCNDNGKRCIPPGILDADPSCKGYERVCFQENKKIALIEFIAPNIDKWPEWGGYNFIELLNNEQPYVHFEEPQPPREVYSINYISTWYNRESKKYNKNIKLEIDIFGPYYLTEFPPLTPYKINQQVYLDIKYLENYAKNQKIDLGYYDAWLPIYIYNYYPLDDEEGTTLHPNSEVISFELGTHRYPSVTMIKTVTHEIAHQFCAEDRYLSYSCIHPEGVPDPDNYPQRQACLMCSSIAFEKEKSTYNIETMDQLVVCNKTAEEFGWIHA